MSIEMKITLAILAVCFVIIQSTPLAMAQTPRLEQLIKDTQSNSGIGNGWWSQKLQKIACNDISGSIENVTLSLEGGPYAYAEVGILLSGDPDLINAYRISPVYKSESVYISSGKADHTFNFTEPADVSYLCNLRDYFYLSIRKTEGTFGGAWIYGSSDPFAYRNEYYGTETSASVYGLADWYFIINDLAPKNSVPEIAFIDNQTISENQDLSFTVSATDPDNDPVTLSVSGLPSGSSFNPVTGEFSWTSGFSDAGEYQVTFTATEDTPEALSDSETVTITVINHNRAPELDIIGNQTVNENETLAFTVSASDPDSDDVVLSAANLPPGATFNPATGEFSWTPGFNDAGNYENIEFTATDNGSPMQLDVELVTITVGDVNRLPEITNPGPQQAREEDTVSFIISTSDPDGDNVTLSATNLPSGASFNAATGAFVWETSLSDAGVYIVTFTATDDGMPAESASVDVVITIGDNPTPAEQAEDLIENVIVIDIPQNIENSYLANLRKVEQFILEGKIQAAVNQLNAFINKINQDRQQGILTQEEYDSLLEAAENLISDLNG